MSTPADEVPQAPEAAAPDGSTLGSGSDPGSEPGVETARTRQDVEFPCDNCGADMTWDPAVDALSCEYCGNEQQVPRGEGTIVERSFDEVSQAETGFGVELRVTKCSNCGARVAFEGSSTSEECVYCGSANVLAQVANRNALRPESLVPLDVSKDDVQASFRRWVKGLWFRPSALKQVERIEGTGIYVPFWTFDAHVHSDWSADAGHYYWDTETYVTMVNGKPQVRTRRVRRIRWVPAWGDRDDVYDDLLVHASKGLSPELVRDLGGFDTTALVPYRPEYLAGWRAEEYQIDLEGGWARGQREIEARQRQRCAGDVPGDTHRNLRVQNHIANVRWKHVLLPIWSLQYRFRGKVYTVLVNGQTGRVTGKAPISWLKILLLVLGVSAAVAATFVILGGVGALS